jgi:hypothetical protein
MTTKVQDHFSGHADRLAPEHGGLPALLRMRLRSRSKAAGIRTPVFMVGKNFMVAVGAITTIP